MRRLRKEVILFKKMSVGSSIPVNIVRILSMVCDNHYKELSMKDIFNISISEKKRKFFQSNL